MRRRRYVVRLWNGWRRPRYWIVSDRRNILGDLIEHPYRRRWYARLEAKRRNQAAR